MVVEAVETEAVEVEAAEAEVAVEVAVEAVEEDHLVAHQLQRPQQHQQHLCRMGIEDL
jgi:hypothetical protein